MAEILVVRDNAATTTMLPRVLPLSYDPVVQPVLNRFMGMGRPAARAVRQRLQALLSAADSPGHDARLEGDAALRAVAVFPGSSVTMHLPADIGDYTDFYSSKDHAYNVGVMMRGAANALQPNWWVDDRCI